MSGGDKSVSYEVGYAKPPKHSQFKKGQSGNRKGRPKGRRTLHKPLKYDLPPEKMKDIFLEEAYRMVSINSESGEHDIPISQAVIRALGVKAAKGNIHAQRLFTQTLMALETENRRQAEAYMESIMSYKTHWEGVLAYRAANGIDEPPPVPHPDNIHVDMNRATVEIRGPLTQEAKEREEHYRALLTEWTGEQERYESILSQPIEHDADNAMHDFASAQLIQCKKITSTLELILGDDEPVPFHKQGRWIDED